jgi:hypothetical protein
MGQMSMHTPSPSQVSLSTFIVGIITTPNRPSSGFFKSF